MGGPQGPGMGPPQHMLGNMGGMGNMSYGGFQNSQDNVQGNMPMQSSMQGNIQGNMQGNMLMGGPIMGQSMMQPHIAPPPGLPPPFVMQQNPPPGLPQGSIGMRGPPAGPPEGPPGMFNSTQTQAYMNTGHVRQQDVQMGFQGPVGPGLGPGAPPPGAPGRGQGRRTSGGRGRGGDGGRGGPLPARGGPARLEGNDYCQHFVDTQQRPQNFLRDAHLEDLYESYPKLGELMRRKDHVVAETATPPYFLKADLRTLPLTVQTFGTKFDVVLIDPPWEEYVRRAPGLGEGIYWRWQDIMALDIESIADTPSFLFLWCGSAEGLDAGRHCLQKWGFRRCEDICWVKTNQDTGKRKYMEGGAADPLSVLQHTKEHCLMGIRGTVRRSTDGHIIHSNVDTDVIVSEEPPYGSTAKPEEMYHLIEHFCLGRRRLELFGEDRNVRPGWVTVGQNLQSSNFNSQAYAAHFRQPDGSTYIENRGKPPPGAVNLTGTTEDIENLRPKSPSMAQRG